MKRMLIAATAAALMTLVTSSANAATSQSQSTNACQGPASWCSVFFGN
jgi:hypothetical protein